MATNRRDVSLVVRAKDEATKAFESAAAALESLLGVNTKVGASATQTGTRLEDLAAIALTIDKAYGKISGAADNAAAAFARQQASITESKSQLAALKGQAEAAAAAIARLKSADAIVDAGRDQSGRIAQLTFLTEQYDRLQAQQAKLTGSIAAQEAALDRQRSSLQQIGSTAIAAAEAQERLAAEILVETDAMHKAAAAADHLSDVQQRINKLTGVDRQQSNSASASAEILAEVANRDHLIQKLKAEQAATAELAATQEAQRRAARLLPGDATTGKSARDSAAVFTAADEKVARDFEAQIRQNAQAAKEMDAAAARLRAQLDPMAEIQDRLNRELAEANALYKAGRISATELAGATKLLKANADNAAQSLGRMGAGSGKPTLFGLKPYELQNLSFQVNDVVTQLASGTSLTQTLAQQGGQLFQIFPKVGSSIIAAFKSPPVLLFGAALTAVVLGLKELQDQATRLREFTGVLQATADAGVAQAESLAKASDQLDRYGLSAKEAVAVVRTFLKEGINPDRITEFGVAAKNMAQVLGVDVKDAAKDLADAFTGGYDAIKKLDDAINFLSATQREHIRVLFEEGRAQEARAEAFRIVSERYDEGARNMRGPWSEAVRSLGNAWDAFIKLIANSPVITSMANALDQLGKSVTSVLNRLAGATTLNDINNDIELYYKRIGELNQHIANLGDPLGFKQRQIDDYAERIKKLYAEQKKLLEQEKQFSGQDTRSNGTEQQRKIDADIERADQKKLAAAKELSHEKRIQLAYEEALLAAQNKGASDAVSRASAERAALIEKQKIEKEITAEKAKQAREEEAAIKSFSKKVVGVESGGNPNAKNPLSTATGLGQFIESTWLDLFRRHFPDEAARMGQDAILALRRDSEISKKMIEIYARENSEVLKKAGQSVTEANLYLTHFLGAAGAKKLLRASADTPVDQILGADQIAANRPILQGKTAGQVRSWAGRKFGEASAADSGVTERLAEIEQQRLDTQTQFNEKIKDENEKRQLGIASMQAQQGLHGEALIAEQRKQAVAEAVLRKQQEIDKLNADRVANGQPADLQFTEAQKKAVEELAGKYFDLAHAKDVAAAQREAAHRPVDDLLAQRDAIQAQIDAYQLQGISVADLEKKLAAVNARLLEAIPNAIAFYESLKNNAAAMAALGLTAEQIEAIIAKLKTVKVEGNGLNTQFLMTGKQINETFAQGAANAFDRFAQAVAEGKDVMSSLKDAFLQFAADFLRQIAQMIIKQMIFNIIGGATGSGGGGLGGGIAGAIGSIFHEGGIAGRSAPTRTIDAGWFQNAMRYHTGGIAGLRPGEVPAILKRGEEVLPQNDPRHVANGGGGGTTSIKNVVVFDPAEVLSKGLASKVGEKVLLNFVRENKGAVQQALSS